MWSVGLVVLLVFVVFIFVGNYFYIGVDCFRSAEKSNNEHYLFALLEQPHIIYMGTLITHDQLQIQESYIANISS